MARRTLIDGVRFGRFDNGAVSMPLGGCCGPLAGWPGPRCTVTSASVVALLFFVMGCGAGAFGDCARSGAVCGDGVGAGWVTGGGAQQGAHTDQSAGTRRNGQAGIQMVSGGPKSAAGHGPDEQGGREDSCSGCPVKRYLAMVGENYRLGVNDLGVEVSRDGRSAGER